MRQMKRHYLPIIYLLIALPTASFAQDVSEDLSEEIAITFGKPSLSLSFGSTAISSNAIVWDDEFGGEANDEKLSQLEWSTYWSPTAEITGQIPFQNGMRLNLGGTFSLSGDSYMVDYDWLGVSSKNKNDWTDRSKHDDTRLEYYYLLDASLSYDWYFNEEQTRISPEIGVNYTRMRWTAYGGDFVYTTGLSGIRDIQGRFPNDSAGISYRINYFTPYVGLNLGHQWQDYEFSIGGKIGTSKSAEGYDYHYSRETRFESDIADTTYYALDAKVSKKVNDNFSLFGGLTWSVYERSSVDETIYYDGEATFDEATGEVNFVDSVFLNDAGAADLQSFTFNIGAEYRF